MFYYILNNGHTRFDLINNYSFDKFWEILSITNGLKVHEAPISEFDAALTVAGFPEKDREKIINNLRLGHNPFYTDNSTSLEKIVRLDVANSAKYESAVNEIGGIFGKDQIGLCLKSTFYRQYLSEASNHDLLQALNNSANLPERQTIIIDIEKNYPDFLSRIIGDLGPNWSRLENKMSFGGVSLEDLLTKSSNTITAEAIITKIEEKRKELKMAKRELIAALKNENPKIKAINQEIARKRKAVEGLKKGLATRPELANKIVGIESDINTLQSQVRGVGLTSFDARYTLLSEDKRKAKIEEETRGLQMLTDKNPSMVLMYLIAELAEEQNLIENDINVLKETGSHLEGPIQMVVDLAKLDRTTISQRVERPVKIRMLDKKDDLMIMVRFADSKICCFSSSNYTMRVAHNIENKYWVSSINKDPLSFVFEIEDVSPDTEGETAQTKNLGFVFGMYGVGDDGDPEIMLNGVYYSGGNDLNSVTNIANAIEEMLSVKIRAKHQLISSMYGGQIQGNMPEYSNQPLEAKRLRAIDNGQGKPETLIYDDLGTQINTKMQFADKVWHKDLPVTEIPKEEEIAVEPSLEVVGDFFTTDTNGEPRPTRPSVRQLFRRLLGK